MFYRTRRRLYSQNFLRSPELITKLIRQSSIGPKDLVVEIGPGNGIITEGLLGQAHSVIAVEKDEGLFNYVRNKFGQVTTISLYLSDFLKFGLPITPYKVFSNIPFNISADIIRKLTGDENFIEGYLIVQKEFAQKLIGMPYDTKNQMMSILLKPWFETSITHSFSRNDFIPQPHVDSVMVKIKRVRYPLLNCNEKGIYESFVIYSYNKERISRISFDKILRRFNAFLTSSNNKKRFVINKAREIQSKQLGIQKVHRTRNDRNWNKF